MSGRSGRVVRKGPPRFTNLFALLRTAYFSRPLTYSHHWHTYDSEALQ